MMPRKLLTEIVAKGYELDSYDHVNNAVFLNYFEHGRWEYFRQTGIYESLKKTGRLPVVTDIHIRYQREIRIFDEIQVESFCKQDGFYLVFRQRLINLTSGLTAARATTKLVFLDHEKSAIDIPQEVLSLI